MLRCAFQPGRLGRQAITRRPTTEHYRALFVGMAFVFLTPLAVVMPIVLVSLLLNLSTIDPSDLKEIVAVLMGVTLFSALATVYVIAGALLAGTLLGTLYGLITKRQVMHLAGQAAAYRSVWLVLWMIAGGVMMMTAFGMMLAAAFGGGPSYAVQIGVLISCLISQGVFAGIYMLFMLPFLRGTRHANL